MSDTDTSILDGIEAFVDPVFKVTLKADNLHGGGIDEAASAFIAWMLHDDTDVHLGEFLHQDFSSIAVWHPTVSHRVLAHVIGKWHLGLSVLNCVQLGDTTLGHYFSSEKMSSARVTFLCALVLESHTYPFEEVFNSVQSEFSSATRKKWQDENNKVLAEWVSKIDEIHEKFIGCLKTQKVLFSGNADCVFQKPDGQGLNILLGLPNSPKKGSRDNSALWKTLRVFMRKGALSLASLDHIIRISRALLVPQPKKIEEDRAVFTEKLMSTLMLYKDGLGEKELDFSVLDQHDGWSIGVPVNNYQQFRRMQRDINLLTEYLHRNIFSEKRYIIGVISVHNALNELFVNDEKKAKDEDKKGPHEKGFYEKLFNFYTSPNIMREYWAIPPPGDKKSKPKEIELNPVRWGRVLCRAQPSCQKLPTLVWERGQQQKSDNNGEEKTLLDDMGGRSPGECFMDTTQLRLCWPNTPTFREYTFSGKIVGAFFSDGAMDTEAIKKRIQRSSVKYLKLRDHF